MTGFFLSFVCLCSIVLAIQRQKEDKQTKPELSLSALLSSHCLNCIHSCNEVTPKWTKNRNSSTLANSGTFFYAVNRITHFDNTYKRIYFPQRWLYHPIHKRYVLPQNLDIWLVEKKFGCEVEEVLFVEFL